MGDNEWRDRLPGGRADDRVPSEFDKGQLTKGVEHEMEHTEDPLLAEEIAMDHLTEHGKYYDLLNSVEKGISREAWLRRADDRELARLKRDKIEGIRRYLMALSRAGKLKELTDHELLFYLTSGALNGIPLSLSGVDLSGADLGEVDFRGADLSEADLQGCNLQGAILRGADLQGADLRGANLRESDIGESNLRRADLANGDFRGANLRGADLRNASLLETKFGGAILQGANLEEAVFWRTDLHGTDLRGAVYDPHEFYNTEGTPIT